MRCGGRFHLFFEFRTSHTQLGLCVIGWPQPGGYTMYSLHFPTFGAGKAVPVLFLPLMIRNDLTHSAASLSTLTARTAKERAPEPAHSRSRARARLLNQEPLGVASFVIDERTREKEPTRATNETRRRTDLALRSARDGFRHRSRVSACQIRVVASTLSYGGCL